MNIFVTGGTGFVGREVLRQLRPAGHAIRMLVRHPQSQQARKAAEEFSPETCPGDVTDAESLGHALRGIEGIIHLVGIIREVGETTFENIHVCGTQNIVAAAQQAGVKRFILMSALGTRPNAVSRYHQTKWAAEEIVRGSGLAWTIFRPSIIYGPGDEFVNLFARIARFSPVLPVFGSGEAKLQPVAVEAVATAFVRALTEPRAVGQTYALCGPERFTMNELLDQILAVLGRRRLKLHLPLSLARIQATVLEVVFPRLLRRAPPLNRDQLIMLSEDNVGDPDPANAVFGLRHSSFREGIARYLKG